MTAEEARELVPRAPGACISINSGRAWQGKYPQRITPGPKSRTHTWGPYPGSQKRCCAKVLQWMWRRHLECLGQPFASCPYTFDDVSDSEDEPA